MPVIHRQRLAARLRQNWSALYSSETTHSNMFQMVDDSLTSLAWLQNLNVMKLTSANAAARSSSVPTTPAVPKTDAKTSPTEITGAAGYRRGLSEDSAYLSRLQVDPNDILDMTNRPGSGTTALNWNPSVTSVAGADGVFDEAASATCQLERERYKLDASIKPPYSYAMLICMAMQETPDKRITLAQIYSWITENFAYYKQADQNWQHSIRHNLSLNKCFQKVPRGKDEPGKGGFWTINPEFNSLVDRGIFKKRRLTVSNDSSGVWPKKESNDANDPNYTSKNRTSASPSASKREDRGSSLLNVKTSDPVLDFRTDSLTDVLDLHWALNQDIDIGGLCVKTGDIIDMQTSSVPTMRITGGLESPPTSSDSDSELELDSLLNFSAFAPTSSHVGTADQIGDSLDLTIHGIGLPPPDWWNESLNGHFRANENTVDLLSSQSNGRMHTPSLARYGDENFHPWAENRNEGLGDSMMAYGAESTLLDTDNLDMTHSFKLI